MRFIDEQTVASALRMEDLIPAMRQAMIDYSDGHTRQPPRQTFGVPGRNAYFGAMPAASANAVGAKLVTVYPRNAAAGLHTHHATIVLFDPDTGVPLIAMDGRLITEMRTAAVSAAFVDAVASTECSTLAVLGAGTQGRSHIAALGLVRRFADVRIWNRTRARAERLAAAVGARVASREEAVRGADVVVVATSSSEPVLDGRWLRHGARVVSVGWAGADGAELDAATMSNVIIVDSRAGATTESGNVRRFDAAIAAELGEVLAGRYPVDRESTVVFDSIGMACQDLAAAALVVEHISRADRAPDVP